MASLERAPRFLNPWSTLLGCSCHPVVMMRLATLLDTLLQKRQLKLKPILVAGSAQYSGSPSGIGLVKRCPGVGETVQRVGPLSC